MQIEPDFRRPLEVAGEAQGGVCGDGTLALHDFIDAPWWNANVVGKAVFGQAKRREKILAENFAGMNGDMFLHDVRGLMVIDDFDFMRPV